MLQPKKSFHLSIGLVFASTVFFVLPGCGTDDPMKLRMEEFRYTTEQLADEVVPRLAAMSRAADAPSKGPDAASQRMAEIEASRGGDGDRPDPNSFEAIVLDTVVKIRGISGTGESGSVADDLIRVLSEKEGVDKVALEKFGQQVREELSKPLLVP